MENSSLSDTFSSRGLGKRGLVFVDDCCFKSWVMWMVGCK